MADTQQAIDQLAALERLAEERALTDWEASERTRLQRIVRINELSALARQRPLTDAETEERTKLRKAFLAMFRQSFSQELESTYVEYPDGSRVKLSDTKNKGG